MRLDLNMNKFKYESIRATSGIIIMTMMGVFGSFCGGYDLENVFLEGVPFPLVLIVLWGIIMNLISLPIAFISYKGVASHEPSTYVSTFRICVNVFGIIAICVYLFLFLIGYINFFAMAPGQREPNANWAAIIFMAYIGIMTQIYLMYKIHKCIGAPPGPPAAPGRS